MIVLVCTSRSSRTGRYDRCTWQVSARQDVACCVKMNACDVCGVESVDVLESAGNCGNCLGRTYCGKVCQTRDWNEGHRRVCATLKLGSHPSVSSSNNALLHLREPHEASKEHAAHIAATDQTYPPRASSTDAQPPRTTTAWVAESNTLFLLADDGDGDGDSGAVEIPVESEWEGASAPAAVAEAAALGEVDAAEGEVLGEGNPEP